MSTDCIDLAGNGAGSSTISNSTSVIALSESSEFHMHNGYYQSATPDHFWIEWRFQVVQRLLQGNRLGDQLLEVGSGNGVVQSQFEAALGVTVDGCDLNRYALEQGLTTRGRRYLYNVLDRRSQWREHFSSVLLMDTLEHIDDPQAFLEAIRFHLQPGGYLVVNVPALPALYSRYDSVQGHVKRYTAGRLQHELESAGFQTVAHRYWGGNLIPIALLRKLLVRFTAHDKVLTAGFAPPSAMADRVLRALRSLEIAGWKLPLGTSVAAVARRVDGASTCMIEARGGSR